MRYQYVIDAIVVNDHYLIVQLIVLLNIYKLKVFVDFDEYSFEENVDQVLTYYNKLID